MPVTSSEVVLVSDIFAWLKRNLQITRLSIAGNRESKNPGIGERVERFLTAVFSRMKQRDDSWGKRSRTRFRACNSFCPSVLLILRPQFFPFLDDDYRIGQNSRLSSLRDEGSRDL